MPLSALAGAARASVCTRSGTSRSPGYAAAAIAAHRVGVSEVLSHAAAAVGTFAPHPAHDSSRRDSGAGTDVLWSKSADLDAVAVPGA
jgi:hypothetical protein